MAMAEVVALATELSAVVESIAEVGCGNCGCWAVASEAPGGTTGIGRDNSGGNGFVVVAIMGRSTAVSGNGAKGSGSGKAGRGGSLVGPGNGGNGEMGTAVSIGSGQMTGVTGVICMATGRSSVAAWVSSSGRLTVDGSGSNVGGEPAGIHDGSGGHLASTTGSGRSTAGTCNGSPGKGSGKGSGEMAGGGSHGDDGDVGCGGIAEATGSNCGAWDTGNSNGSGGAGSGGAEAVGSGGGSAGEMSAEGTGSMGSGGSGNGNGSSGSAATDGEMCIVSWA